MITERQVKNWMTNCISEFVDPVTDEVNLTLLAEEACEHFNAYENEDDYRIPDVFFELAFDVGKRYERRHSKS
jgi:hypothetical protein